MSRPLAFLYGGVACLLCATFLLRLFFLSMSSLMWRLVFLLPLAQLVLAAVVAVRYRQNRRIWVHLAATTAFVFGVAISILQNKFDRILLPITDMLIHVALPVCWIIVLAGIPAAPWLLKKRCYVFLRIWLMLAATFAVGEPAAWLMEREPSFALELPETFSNPEPETIHIAAIGGSSTLGHPYQPKFGFVQVVGWRLQDLYPNHKVVIHNLAMGGSNLQEAAQKLHQLEVRPHLLLIYTGHNEFYHQMRDFLDRPSRWSFVNPWMEWSALFRVSDRWLARNRLIQDFRMGVRSLIDVPIATRTIYNERLERFRSQCQQLNEFCRRESIRPVWFIPAASESGFEPNRSGDRDSLNDRQQAELRDIIQQASAAETEEAVRLYRLGLSRFPDFAELHFRLAEALRRAGQYAQAKEHFAQALNLDQHPIRANEDYRQVIRDTAEKANAPLVETIDYLRQHTDDGILDEELFLDNVHMNLKGYYLTGLAGCEVIANSGVLEDEFGSPAPAPPLTLADAIERAGLDRDDLAEAYRLTAFGLQELKRWRFDETVRQEQASRFEKMADALEAGAIDPGEAGTESLSPQ